MCTVLCGLRPQAAFGGMRIMPPPGTGESPTRLWSQPP